MVNKSILTNGIRVITQSVDAVKSVSVGVWVDCGSRWESLETNGISHFIEHMLFKGTANRSAFDIASQIDAVGGIINAFTGKEYTSYYAKLPEYCLPLGLEIIADMVLNSRFSPEEIEKEKGVVLSEIGMLEDTPDEYIHDIFEETFWREHPLRFPILGTRDIVKEFNDDKIRNFFSSHYCAENIVISIAGVIEHETAVALVEREFGSLSAKSSRSVTTSLPPQFCATNKVVWRETEQVSVVIGMGAPAANSEQRYALALMNAFLGGSMSSRLFQEIREKRGLAYSVNSFVSPYADTGLFGICAGMAKEDCAKVIALSLDECRRLTDTPPTDKELQDAKGMLKGNFLLGMESTDARMTKLAKNEITFGRHVGTKEIMDGVDAVNSSEILQLCQEIFNPQEMSIAVIGDVKEKDL